jgi:hypothetical protein
MLQKVTRRPAGGSTARKTFHLNEILSVVAGLPLSKEGSAAIHRLVAFMMEAEASSLGTTTNAEAVRRSMEDQLPFLKEVNLAGLHQIYQYNADSPDPNPYLEVWLEMQALRYGAEHALMPLSRWQGQQQQAASAHGRLRTTTTA